LVRVQRLRIRELGVSGCRINPGHPAPGHPPAQSSGEVQTQKPSPGSRENKMGAPAGRDLNRPLAQPGKSLAQSLPLRVQALSICRRDNRITRPHRNPGGNEGSRERQSRETRRGKVRLCASGDCGLRVQGFKGPRVRGNGTPETNGEKRE